MPRSSRPVPAACWLLRNARLTSEQIAGFTGMTPHEVRSLLMASIDAGMHPFNPVAAGELTTEQVAAAEADPNLPLRPDVVIASSREPVFFTIAGTRYYRARQEMPEEGDCLVLEPEPENAHDRFAVRVLTGGREHLGYVPQTLSERVSGLLSSRSFVATVTESRFGPVPLIRVRLR